MADNFEANPGSGGAIFAGDDIGGVYFPRVKFTLGADGVNDGDVSASNPLPVTGTVAVTHAALTELAAAINTNQLDVNIAAQAGAITVASHAVTNAGTFAVQVDGSALTALQLLDDVVYVDDADWTDDTSKHVLIGGLYQSTPQIITDGDVGPLQVDENGVLKVNIVAGAGSGGGTSAADDADFTDGTTAGTPAMGVYESTPTTVTDGDLGIVGITEDRALKVSLVNATVAVTQSGTWDEVGIHDSGNSITVDNGGTFVVQENGAALTALQVIDNPVLVDDAAFTPASSSVMMAGFQADETATDSVNEGDAGAARMTLDRKVITNPQPHDAGGMSISRDIDLDNGTLTVVKNSPGQVYGWDITNTTTATVFVKFYDATSGTLGTGTPVLTIAIPGNANDDTLSSKSLPYGILFGTGICVGAGTGVADADNTDPGANGVVANIYYK